MTTEQPFQAAAKQSTSSWTEVHRPRRLEDIVHQETAVAALQSFLNSQDLPNLLLYGPQGVGKTTAIEAFAHSYFKEKYRERVFEFNASSERGVNAIRTKVKPLSQYQVTGGYKLIILEEADALTREAEAALRRILEDSAASTRVCLCCNYVSQIIEPLASRCAKVKFEPLPVEKIAMQLENIANREKFELTEKAGLMIAAGARGDMRCAVTDLQLHRVMGGTLVDETICSNFLKIEGEITMATAEKVLITWLPGSSDASAQQLLQEIMASGIDYEKALLKIFELLLMDERFNDEMRMRFGQEYARFGGFIARRGGEDAAFARVFWSCRALGCYE